MSALGIVVRDPETEILAGSIGLLGRRNPLRIEIVPNRLKHGDTQPDFFVNAGPNNLGAGWIKVSREKRSRYISLRIFHPQIAPYPIYANLGRAAGQDDDDVLAVIVNPVG
jgi:uncharacterized protein (DUF736 family)